ncbi:MAG: hypothetical protein ACK5M7_14070 [Draconibacterium sp.]
MTLIEYFKLNKSVTKFTLKISGVLFSGILAILFLIFGLDNKRELMDGFYLFLVCFILGNLLGLSFFALAFSLGYSQVKSQIILFSKIPSDIKDLLGLKLFFRPPASKFSFTELDIIGFDNNSFVHFDYDRGEKLVWITIRNIMNDIDDFNSKKREIDSKYKRDSVFLSGLGLKKEIKWKQWKKFTDDDVKSQIIQLYTISEKENLRVEKMYYKINWTQSDSASQ